MKNHKNQPRTMKNQPGWLQETPRRKWGFFVTNRHTLHHNIYIIIIVIIVTIMRELSVDVDHTQGECVCELWRRHRRADLESRGPKTSLGAPISNAWLLLGLCFKYGHCPSLYLSVFRIFRLLFMDLAHILDNSTSTFYWQLAMFTTWPGTTWGSRWRWSTPLWTTWEWRWAWCWWTPTLGSINFEALHLTQKKRYDMTHDRS